VKIEKPGFYRTAGGHKAQVIDIQGNFAVGWVPRRGLLNPHHWRTNGSVWNGDCDTDIVSEWRDPVSHSITLELCLNTADQPFIRTAGNYGQDLKVLARKTITITEGEGMSTAGEKSPDL
jgi:hypothetical protein